MDETTIAGSIVTPIGEGFAPVNCPYKGQSKTRHDVSLVQRGMSHEQQDHYWCRTCERSFYGDIGW